MRIHRARLLLLLVAAVFVLVACGTSNPQARTGDLQGPEAVAEVGAESVEGDTEQGAQADVDDTTTVVPPTVTDGDSGAATERDPDTSPPTTETDGLASSAEAATVPNPDDLTCWRVEDFGEEAADRWRVINDGVMGGRSEGELEFGGGVATFTGAIDTNGGGFSMIRAAVFRNGESLADALAGAEYLRVRTRSANGRGYELTVQDSTTNTALMHFADIAVTADSAWEEPLVPLANLDARVFGTDRSTLPAFDLEQISTIGIILADGLDGPFSLAIDRIDACARP